MIVGQPSKPPLGGYEIGRTESEPMSELQHHGVLGMKWGHRKAATSADIHAARRRIGGLQTANDVAMRQRRMTKKGSADRVKADATVAKIHKDFKNSPDRVIATRMTTGEKAAALIFAGPIGLIPIAATSAVSRRIEQKQSNNAHGKK